MKLCWLKVLLLYLILGNAPAAADQPGMKPDEDESVTVIRHYQKAFRYEYHLELLNLVLSATEDEFGPYRLQPVPEEGPEVSEARGVRMLERGLIDVVFLSTSRGREERFRPVRTPLLKGLLGFRLLLIDQSNQHRFSNVSSLSSLKSDFKLGFNPHWVDYGIYEANGFKLANSVQYEELFSMLTAGRFDFFPRGVNEIWQEHAYFSSIYPSLEVEQELALFYPYPVYFFVDHENDQLHERLTRGLEIIEEDGRFRELLRDHFQEAVTKANLNERRLFELENPLLPDGAPAEEMNWWMKQPTD